MYLYNSAKEILRTLINVGGNPFFFLIYGAPDEKQITFHNNQDLNLQQVLQNKILIPCNNC